MNDATTFIQPERFQGARTCVSLLLVLLAWAPRGFAGNSPDAYHETIVLERDGSAAVTVRWHPAARPPADTLVLPYAHTAWPDSFAHSQNVAAVLPGRDARPRTLLVILDSSVAGGGVIEVSFRLPSAAPLGTAPPGEFGNYTVGYRTVNSTPTGIGRFTVTLALPAGFVFASITSTTPARPANGAGSPYALGKQEGRHSITLSDTSVLQGDVIALNVQAKDGAKSPLLMAALVLLGGAYLVLFRDLVFS